MLYVLAEDKTLQLDFYSSKKETLEPVCFVRFEADWFVVPFVWKGSDDICGWVLW